MGRTGRNLARRIARGLIAASIGSLPFAVPAAVADTPPPSATTESSAPSSPPAWATTRPPVSTGAPDDASSPAHPPGITGSSDASSATPRATAGRRAPGSPNTAPTPPVTPMVTLSPHPAHPTPAVTRTPRHTHPTPMLTLTPHRARPTPAPSTAARLNLSTSVHTAQRHTTTVIYRVTVGPDRGTAPHTVVTVATRPRITWTSRPEACAGGATSRCALGGLRGPQTLTFVLADAPHPRQPTIVASATAAGIRSCSATTVLVLPDRRAPHGSPDPRGTRTPGAEHHRHAERHAPPRATKHATHRSPDRRAAGTSPGERASDPPTRRPASPPAASSAPAAPNAIGTPDTRPTLGAGRAPSIAPPPGPSPTPAGPPAAMRPAADGTTFPTGTAGVPLRKILGVLAASVSFVGLVTAISLYRRRND